MKILWTHGFPKGTNMKIYETIGRLEGFRFTGIDHSDNIGGFPGFCSFLKRMGYPESHDRLQVPILTYTKMDLEVAPF